MQSKTTEARASKVATNAVVLLVTSVIALGLGYLFQFLCIRFLTVPEYGMYRSVLSVYNVALMLSSLGLSSSILKHVAEGIGKRDYQGVSRTIVAGTQLALVMGAFVLLILFLMRDILATSFLKDAELIPLIALCAPLAMMRLFRNVPQGIYYGYQRMTSYMIMSLVEQVAKIIIVLLLFYTGIRMTAPLISWNIALLLSLIVAIVLIKRLKAPVKLTNFRSVDLSQIKKVALFGIFVFGAAVLAGIMKNADVLALKIITQSNETVGYYGVSALFASIFLMVPNALGGSAFPYIAQKRGENNRVRSDLIFGSLFFLMLPLMFVMTFFLNEIIVLLFKPIYLPASVPGAILILGSFFFSIYVVSFSFVATSKNPKRIFYILLLAVPLNIAGNILLIPHYDMLGAAVATAFSFLICAAGGLLILKRDKELPVLSVWKAAAANLVFLVPVYFLCQNLPLGVKIPIALSSVALSILLWKILYPELLDLFRQFFQTIRRHSS